MNRIVNHFHKMSFVRKWLVVVLAMSIVLCLVRNDTISAVACIAGVAAMLFYSLAVYNRDNTPHTLWGRSLRVILGAFIGCLFGVVLAWCIIHLLFNRAAVTSEVRGILMLLVAFVTGGICAFRPGIAYALVAFMLSIHLEDLLILTSVITHRKSSIRPVPQIDRAEIASVDVEKSPQD